MKIIHVCETLPGGPASYLDEILPAQVAENGEGNVVLIAPDNHFHHLSVGANGVAAVPFLRNGRNIRSMLNLGKALLRAIREHRPDIVHLHSSFAGVVGRILIAFLKDRPAVVYCPHGWPFDREVSVLGRRTFELVEKCLAQLTDVIINVSEYEDRLARRAGLDRRKCRTILSGISDLPNNVNWDVSFSDRDINVLFLGRLDRPKGFDLLIGSHKMWSDLPLHLHVLGDTVNDSMSGIMKKPLKNVTYYGWVPRDKITAYVEAADILMMPSRQEAFGLAALEAMRGRRAIAVSNKGALPEVVENGVTGILFDLKDVASTMESIVQAGRGRLREMGEAGRKRYEVKFRSERMNREIHNLYLDLAGGRRKRLNGHTSPDPESRASQHFR